MNKKTKQIVFIVIAILALFKFTLLFATGGVPEINTFASWIIWLSFIVGLILMWFLYGWAFKAVYSLKFIIILWLSVGIILCVIGFSTGAVQFGGSIDVNKQNSSNLSSPSSSKNSSSTSLVKCASTATSALGSVPGFKAEMFVSTMTANREPGEKTSTRVFSLADYADEKANPIKDFKNPVEKTTLKEDLFYTVSTANNSPYTGVFTGQIQVCDKNNMTLNGDLPKNPPALPKETIGFDDNLHGLNNYGIMPGPGDYRIDGYLYVDGKWTLTNRIDKITLTK